MDYIDKMLSDLYELAKMSKDNKGSDYNIEGIEKDRCYNLTIFNEYSREQRIDLKSSSIISHNTWKRGLKL